MLTHVIHTSFIAQLEGLYASQTTAELSSFLSLVRSPFNFQSYWVKQMLSIDTKVPIKIVDKNNFYQMTDVGKSGMGRTLNATSLYEGQFANDKMHGYGRLITIDETVDPRTSSVLEGWFVDGQYAAVNQSVYEIQQYLDTPLFDASSFVEAPTGDAVATQKTNAFFNKMWSMLGPFNLQAQADAYF